MHLFFFYKRFLFTSDFQILAIHVAIMFQIVFEKKKKDLVRYNWHIAPKGYNLMFYIRILCSNRYHNQDDKYIHHSPKFPLDPFFINPLWHHSLQPQPCLQRSKLQIISQACLLEGINKLHCTEVCFLSL